MSIQKSFSLPVQDLENFFFRSSEDLRSLKGAHILLTGCTSFFGKWITESLLFANEVMGLKIKLTSISRSPGKFLNDMPHLATQNSLSLQSGDMVSFDFKKLGPFSHAIHAANLPNDGSDDWPSRHMYAAVGGTSKLMEAAAACGCRSVLLISSGAAYQAEPTLIPSMTEPTPLWEKQQEARDYINEPAIYGLTKRYLEAFITALGTEVGVKTSIARCFSFAGPYMPLDGSQALGNFIRDAISRQNIIIKGDGTPIRSYMYGEDLVVWLLALLVRGRHGVPYNVGSEESVSIKEAAELVVNNSGKYIGVITLGKTTHGNAPSVYVPDTSRARRELSLACAYDLAQIVSKTKSWLQAHYN